MRTRTTGAAHIVGLCTPWVKPALRRRTAADIDAATDLLARLEVCDGPLRGPVPADPHPPVGCGGSGTDQREESAQ